jgi:GT2 family glycosyltransferase
MKLTYSVVLYNNRNNQVDALCQNILQTVPANVEYELYFVNNSPGNLDLRDCLQSLLEKHEHVQVIQAVANRGFGAGHNLVINRVNSDYHIIVNPDVIIPDATQIATMIDYMQTSDVVLLCPRITDSNGRIQKLVKRTPTVFDMGIRFLGPRFFPKRQRYFTFDDMYEEIHESDNLSGAFMIFRTAELQSIGGFDERYFLYMEDADISRSMASLGKTIYFPDAHIFHEWQRGNHKSIRGIKTMIVSMYLYFQKWGWKFI